MKHDISIKTAIKIDKVSFEIDLLTLDSIDEYYEIGNSQSICVGSAHYFNKPDTLVLVAYIGKTQVATIEIALSDCHIIQCRAFANGVCEYQDRIAKIINANINMIAERKTA